MDRDLPQPQPPIYPPRPATEPEPVKPDPTINPYATEIDPNEVTPDPVPGTTPPVVESKPPHPYDDLPHKPHHFLTKKALILGALFLLTALLSSFVTYSLVNSRAETNVPATPTPQAVEPTPDPTADWQTYSDPEYSVKYPMDWSTAASTDTTRIFGPTSVMTAYTTLTSPPTDLPSVLGIEILADGAATYTPDPLASSEIATIDGKGFSRTTASDSAGVSVVEYNFVEGTKLYRISYASDPTNNDLFERIISTITFTPSNAMTPGGETGACTMDARICNDGSSVGRVPPSCEFAACPQ